MDENFDHHQMGAAWPAIAQIPGRWLVAMLAMSALVVVALLAHSGLVVDAGDAGFVGFCGGGVVLAGVWALGRRGGTRNHERLRDFASHGLVLMAICLLGAVASYGAASDSSGFDDAMLERADRLLHFDWLAWYRMVALHPGLQYVGATLYASAWVTPWVLVSYLSWTGGRAHLRQFLFTFWLAAVLTLALFPLFPARGALEFLWHGPIPYMPTNGLWQGIVIPALRAHTMTRIEFTALKGLVCAPSFHTVLAVVYMVSVWPFARLRMWLVPLNAAMLVTVPVEGTHYLTDMVMGAAVALVAIAITRAVVAPLAMRRMARLPGAVFISSVAAGRSRQA